MARTSHYSLRELEDFARDYTYDKASLPVEFSEDHYSRHVLHKDQHIEIVVICFSEGQTSSVHDHRGSNCVIRLVRGKIQEHLFEDRGENHEYLKSHCLNPGDVSGLDGTQVHQLSNLSKSGSVLLNFYSPPFA